ncbi:MAG: enoyl-CoA hydratase/isomerase family protein, partial [Pseudomonadota bacterium]
MNTATAAAAEGAPTTTKVLTSCEDGVARIVFNQPEKRNAVSLEMWEAVEYWLDAYAADGSVRVLILSGAGGKAF